MKRMRTKSNCTTSVLYRIRQNIKAYHKHMTTEYLDKLDLQSLLRFTHPTDRQDFSLELYRQGFLTEEEHKQSKRGQGWN